VRGNYTYISRRATLCSGISDVGIHGKRLRQLVHIQRGDEFPERLFTLLELAVVQR
jgi:hypothetical protein